jgi:hypothetical protein
LSAGSGKAEKGEERVYRARGEEESFSIKEKKVSQENACRMVKVFGKALAHPLVLYFPSGLDPEVCKSALHGSYGLPLVEGQNRRR